MGNLETSPSANSAKSAADHASAGAEQTERMATASSVGGASFARVDGALPELGKRIRTYRRMRKVTLKQLADRVGVTEGFISQIERGVSGASVTTLHFIAEAFDLTIADLFTDDINLVPQVLRDRERPRLEFAGVTKRMVTRKPLQNLEVLQGDFDPGAAVGGPNNCHGDSQELLFILSGEFRLELGEDVFSLRAQDSIEYRSSIPHRLTNEGSDSGQALWIISPPSL